MSYKIIVGRDEADKKKFGDEGTIYLGKHYVQMGETTALSSKVYVDVARTHVILVSGKRGSGKSYSLSVIAEEIAHLPEDVAKNVAVLIFDTMGIFWTMEYPNSRQEKLLKEWDLKPVGMGVDIYVPTGSFEDYKKRGVPADYDFSIKTSELDAGDWCNAFDVKLTSNIGVLIERIIKNLREKYGGDFGIDDILKFIERDHKVDNATRNATENRFVAAQNWGLFSDGGTEIKDLVKGGRTSILDVSCYSGGGSWSIKGLVIGLIARKLLEERMVVRKAEEVEDIESSKSIFSEKRSKDMPVVWILIDEAHEVLPKVGKSAASDDLIRLLREGRQPGISLVLATQQPGEIHQDVITQSDIVLSHRLTAKRDIDALNSMMQSYLTKDIMRHLNELPRSTGSAILLDDNSERIFPILVRPKKSWHGGEAPSSVKLKKSFLQELGLEK